MFEWLTLNKPGFQLYKKDIILNKIVFLNAISPLKYYLFLYYTRNIHRRNLTLIFNILSFMI